METLELINQYSETYTGKNIIEIAIILAIIIPAAIIVIRERKHHKRK